MKQKIIAGQNEINKLNDIIEMNKNISSINNNLSNLISFTGTKNSKDKEKDKENSNNSNNSNNNNNSQEKNNLNEKIEELKKILCSDQTIYKEFHKKIDKIINFHSAKNNLSQLQKDFLITIIKNSNYKIQMLDIQYKNMLIKVKNEIKNNYIKELERQIQYRDNIIHENNIDIYSKLNLNNNFIKELPLLKKDFKQKISKNFHSNFGLFHQSENIPYQNMYNTNPNKKNNSNTNTVNLNQLVINDKFNNKKKFEESKNEESETIIKCGLLKKQSPYYYYDLRKIVLYDTPKIEYIDPEKKIVKGRIKLTKECYAQLTKSNQFKLYTPARTFVFMCKERYNISPWVSAINYAIEKYA
jgi:hypothetical protein